MVLLVLTWLLFISFHTDKCYLKLIDRLARNKEKTNQQNTGEVSWMLNELFTQRKWTIATDLELYVFVKYGVEGRCNKKVPGGREILTLRYFNKNGALSIINMRWNLKLTSPLQQRKCLSLMVVMSSWKVLGSEFSGVYVEVSSWARCLWPSLLLPRSSQVAPGWVHVTKPTCGSLSLSPGILEPL